MADETPNNPHFLKPLLPGFNTHLNIPVAFFSKHIQGRNKKNITAKLRSDVSDETWTVKMEGFKLTDGWEAFTMAHDLRIGDIIIFRHEGDMMFHVTALGPSCCEIQYTSSSSSSSSCHNINDDHQTNNIGKSSREKTNRVNKVESSTNHSCFVTNVSASSLKCDRLYIPLSFARSNGLHKMSGKKIILLNEKGRSWSLRLTHYKAAMLTYIKLGWRSFCAENGMSRGQYTFKLVRKSEPLVIRLCREEHIPESESESESDTSSEDDSSSQYQESEKDSLGEDSSKEQESENESLEDKSITQEKKILRCRASSSYNQGRFVTLTLTPSAVKHYKLILPMRFTRANGLNEPGKITLLSKDGIKQVVDLLWNNRNGVLRIGKGWREFCEAHDVKIGEPFVLELMWDEEASPVLKFFTKLNSL
ncbi:unnamed protein product [Cochlearia groenlandica]